MHKPDEKVYLGDGVYAKFDGRGIILTTENGLRCTNHIYFEPEVVAAYEQYIAALKGLLEKKPA